MDSKTDSTATVILITSDNERVSVDRDNLAAQSKMLKDMLSIPSDGSNEVTIPESKAVLDALLPYCGQGKLEPFKLDGPLAWSLIKAFDKYDIGRGCDAVAGAIECARLDESRTWRSLVTGYLYALNFAPNSIDKIVGVIVGHSSAHQATIMWALNSFAQEENVSDDGKLSALLKRRQLILLEKRSNELTTRIIAKLEAQHWKNSTTYHNVAGMLKAWRDSSVCLSSSELDQFLVDTPIGSYNDSNFLPWAELKAVIAALPTKLD